MLCGRLNFIFVFCRKISLQSGVDSIIEGACIMAFLLNYYTKKKNISPNITSEKIFIKILYSYNFSESCSDKNHDSNMQKPLEKLQKKKRIVGTIDPQLVQLTSATCQLHKPTGLLATETQIFFFFLKNDCFFFFLISINIIIIIKFINYYYKN